MKTMKRRMGALQMIGGELFPREQVVLPRIITVIRRRNAVFIAAESDCIGPKFTGPSTILGLLFQIRLQQLPAEYVNSQMSHYSQYGHYYNGYENINNFATAQDGGKMPRNSEKTEFVQHDGLTGKSSTVTVKKGNVLEIVPATNATASTASSKEPQPIKTKKLTPKLSRDDIMAEPETKRNSSTGISDDELARKIDEKENNANVRSGASSSKITCEQDSWELKKKKSLKLIATT